MANKYYRQGFKGGMIVNTLKNIYKADNTGKKDEIIKSMNKRLKKENKKIEQEPAELERYTDLMVSDFENKTFFPLKLERLLKGPIDCSVQK